MYDNKNINYIKAITPIHAGAGQGLDTVDMPIQRERHSNIPKIEASTLKGSIKSWIYRKIDSQEKIQREEEKAKLFKVFGAIDGNDSASRIGITDAKLLFFSIKSSESIFKLITCPYILKRWYEDITFIGDTASSKQENNFEKLEIQDGQCICYDKKKSNKIFLEEYIFEKITDKNNIFKDIEKLTSNIEVDLSKIVIINDSEFIDLVSMYTEIITRNKISVETGTAEEGGLFTEEYLPTESILYFVALSTPPFNVNDKMTSEEVMKYFEQNLDVNFQVGGNSTIGKGFVKLLKKEVKSK